MKGYMGKTLWVDLTSKKIEEKPLEEGVARKYLGGAGLAARIIYDLVGPEVDPLSPENVLVFADGPLQGTGVPFSSRFAVAAKSPLTGVWGEATSGGCFGPAFKRAGYDAIVFTGKAEKPVYLYLTDDIVELRDASHLWGLDSYETETRIRKDLKDPDIRVACIGQAGENMVSFAAVMNDWGRAAGRSGMGTVMGSKNLKAIAAHGSKDIEVANPEELFRLVKGAIELGKNGPLGPIFAKYGTNMFLDAFESIGDVPFRYWTASDAVRGKNAKISSAIGGGSVYRKLMINNFHCEYCPIGCGRDVRVKSPEKYAFEGHGYEYETGGSVGSLCMIDSVEAVAKANDLMGRYGLDTIETGSLIAFSMLCHEKGWLSKEDTDGIELKFGNADAMVEMINRIAFRKGFGDTLADGLRPAAKRIGHGSEKVTMECKGQAFAMHDPRTFHGLAISYGTSPRGACHVRGMGWLELTGGSAFHLDKERRVTKYSLKGHARSTVVTQNIAESMNSLCACDFSMMGFLNPNVFAAMVSAITGWKMDVRELVIVGERQLQLKRLFNYRNGITRKDDIIPEMIPAAASGNYVPKGEELQHEMDEYYRLRGWSKDGVPTRKTIEKLGIENVRETLPNEEV